METSRSLMSRKGVEDKRSKLLCISQDVGPFYNHLQNPPGQAANSDAHGPSGSALLCDPNCLRAACNSGYDQKNVLGTILNLSNGELRTMEVHPVQGLHRLKDRKKYWHSCLICFFRQLDVC